jgi:hypothetical protein
LRDTTARVSRADLESPGRSAHFMADVIPADLNRSTLLDWGFAVSETDVDVKVVAVA